MRRCFISLRGPQIMQTQTMALIIAPYAPAPDRASAGTNGRAVNPCVTSAQTVHSVMLQCMAGTVRGATLSRLPPSQLQRRLLLPALYAPCVRYGPRAQCRTTPYCGGGGEAAVRDGARGSGCGIFGKGSSGLRSAHPRGERMRTTPKAHYSGGGRRNPSGMPAATLRRSPRGFMRCAVGHRIGMSTV